MADGQRTPQPLETPVRIANLAFVGLGGVLVLVCLLLFGQTIGFGFVRADDADLITGNQAFLSELSNAPRVFLRSYFEVDGELSNLETYYRPLVVLSFMVDAQFAGGGQAVYHATNIILHAIVVVLLFGLALRLGAGRYAAFGAALLFAVHPLTVQTVSWIVGRNDSLLAIFALLSLIGLDAAVRDKRVWGFWLHLVTFALALFTKETGIVLLPAYGLIVWLWYDRLGFYREVRWLPWSYFGAAGVWMAVRHFALAGGEVSATPGESLMTFAHNFPQLLAYFGKAVFPVSLNVMPSVDPHALGLGVVAVGVLGVTLRRLPTRRMAVVLSWFVLFLLPPLVVPNLPAYEHRTYVPLLGLAIGLSQLPSLAGNQWRWTGSRYVLVALTIVFGVLTLRHVPTFHDPLTFWVSATRNTAYAPIAHVNVGRILEELDQPGRAAAEYRMALAIDPMTPKANNNLGVTLMTQGRREFALPYFERELEVNPINAEAHFNIGLFHAVSGRPADGVPHWEAALHHNPYFVPAYEQLIEHYGQIRNPAKRDEYQEQLDVLLQRVVAR